MPPPPSSSGPNGTPTGLPICIAARNKSHCQGGMFFSDDWVPGPIRWVWHAAAQYWWQAHPAQVEASSPSSWNCRANVSLPLWQNPSWWMTLLAAWVVTSWPCSLAQGDSPYQEILECVWRAWGVGSSWKLWLHYLMWLCPPHCSWKDLLRAQGNSNYVDSHLYPGISWTHPPNSWRTWLFKAVLAPKPMILYGGFV